MNDENFIMQIRVIRETFNDERKVKCSLPLNEMDLDGTPFEDGELLKTENGEIIYLQFQMKDFDECELTKYAGLAERIYEKTRKSVSIYLLCPKNINVLVKECDLKSPAEFSIKLACVEADPCQDILNMIKRKINSGKRLDDEDLKALSMLPVRCNKNERDYYRWQYLKIINEHNY